jgi:hypothetical protein
MVTPTKKRVHADDGALPPIPRELWPLINAEGQLRPEYQPRLASIGNAIWPDEYRTYQTLWLEYVKANQRPGPRGRGGTLWRDAVSQDQQFQAYIAQRKD